MFIKKSTMEDIEQKALYLKASMMIIQLYFKEDGDTKMAKFCEEGIKRATDIEEYCKKDETVNNIIVWKDEDGGCHTETFENDWALFTEYARLECFSDCYSAKVMVAIANGQKVEYVGWQSGMLYEFKNEKGDIVWSEQFLEWNH